jgi:hypothetical protein
MNWVVANMKWIMLVSGVLTCSMLFTAFAPHQAMRSNFGETLEGPAAEIVVRSWGGLIALGGGMLIYAAFHPPSRPLALAFTGLGKLLFIALVLAHGDKYLGHQAGVAVVFDSLMVLLFATYLVATSRSRGTQA